MQFPPDLVILDCDGVLVDSEPITNGIMARSLGRYGLQVAQSEVFSFFVGGTIPSVMAEARRQGADLPDTWLEEIYGEIYAALQTQCAAIAGIDVALDALDTAGVAYAVGSNGPHDKMRITLQKTGLWDRLEGRIVSREDVAAPKPAPDVYLKAAAICGVPPDRAVVVEDSPTGARAAQAAGMICFGYAGDTEPAALAPLCAAVFDDMAHLPRLLGIAG